MQAKIIGLEFSCKSDTPWSTALWRERDTEANEIIVGLPDGVRKVRTIRRFSPSLQWHAEPLLSLVLFTLEALQKPRSKALAIVPEAEHPLRHLKRPLRTLRFKSSLNSLAVCSSFKRFCSTLES